MILVSYLYLNFVFMKTASRCEASGVSYFVCLTL